MRVTTNAFLVYEILPGVLFQRGKTHSISDVNKARGVAQLGLTHTVALAPASPDPAMVVLNDLAISRYTHFPIPDSRLRTCDELLTLAAQLAQEIAAGGHILTTCNAGRNRSGLLSALIVREISGIPGEAAMQLVQEQRPNAIANPHFAEWLCALS